LSFTTLSTGRISATISFPGGQLTLPFTVTPATLSSPPLLTLLTKPDTPGTPPPKSAGTVMCATLPSVLGEQGDFQEIAISKIPNPAVAPTL
jgi:hypothetical protein